MRVIVTRKPRRRLHHIAPFPEAFPLPFVVFGNGMGLLKVECNRTNDGLLYCVLFGNHVRHELGVDTQG
jgi:hypothetical protein